MKQNFEVEEVFPPSYLHPFAHVVVSVPLDELHGASGLKPVDQQAEGPQTHHHTAHHSARHRVSDLSQYQEILSNWSGGEMVEVVTREERARNQ